MTGVEVFPGNLVRAVEMAGVQCVAHVKVWTDRRYKLNMECGGRSASRASRRVRGVKNKRTSVPTAGSDLWRSSGHTRA